MTFKELLYEYRFITIPFIAWVSAQIIKFIVNFIFSKKIDFTRLTGSGGMPSSHTSLTVALATVIGISEGTGSADFALALIFAMVVMYDAAGVRRAAGKQAKVLNRFFYHQKDNFHFDEELKELLGHTPVEVIAGAALGFAIAYLLMP
jgi:uncharacterized protein